MEKSKTVNVWSIILTLIPLLAVMWVIFYFSSQTAEVSSEESAGIVDIIVGAIMKLFGEMPQDKYESFVGTITFLVRKLAHFSEFAALGFFLQMHLRTWVKNKVWLVSGITGILYACSDEFHQNFVSERAPQLRDVIIDASGVISGILVFILLVMIIGKIAEKRKSKS